jgi:uncharacterized protein
MTSETDPAPRDGEAIDTYVHHAWPTQSELQSYMSAGWTVFLGRPGEIRGGRGQAPALPPRTYEHPAGGYLPSTADAEHVPGSDPEITDAFLREHGVGRAIVGFDHGLLAPAALNPYLGLEVARAANAWSMDHWLNDDAGRWHGLVLVPNHLPAQAAEEIRSVGEHERIVGVVMGGNGLGHPFGNPIYHGIYDAAAEMGLPVVIHVGGEIPPNTSSHPTAGGLPTTYAEFYALRAQSVLTHLTSLIIQGVLERHRDLKVLIAGAGTAWIPGFLWRLDADFRSQGAREAPWLERMPSEQFMAQVRVTTYAGARGVAPERAIALAETVPGAEEVICYASGYPRWDAEVPETVVSRYPEAWRDKVLHDNALDLFRWPDRESGAVRATAKEA